MSLTFSLLKPPPKLTTQFLNGTYTPTTTTLSTTFSNLTLTTAPPTTTTHTLTIKAMKSLQGKVVCATNDKTVAVEVTRLAPHPKYKRRVRKKKRFQAHDPENVFKVGDWVQLEKCRPISKTKTFLAVAPPARNEKAKVKAVDLGLPLESQQKEDGGVKDEDKTV